LPWKNLLLKIILNDYDLMYSIRNTSVIHGENLPMIFRYSSIYKSIISNRMAPEFLNRAGSFLELVGLWRDLESLAERLGRIDVLSSKNLFRVYNVFMRSGLMN
jgi:hypothetical protein